VHPPSCVRTQRQNANLENPLQSKLDESRIPCGQDFPERSPGCQAVLRVTEIDIVEQIEVLVPELDFPPSFRYGEVLEDRKIIVDDTWPPNCVSAHIAEGAVSCDAESVDIEVLINQLTVRPSVVEVWILSGEISIVGAKPYQRLISSAHNREGVTSLYRCDPIKLPSIHEGTGDPGVIEMTQLP